MTAQQPILRYTVSGARRWSNYIWGALLFLGGSGFLLTGISSYVQTQLIPFVETPPIQFFRRDWLCVFMGSLGFS